MDYVIQIMVEDIHKDALWLTTMGKLTALDHLMSQQKPIKRDHFLVCLDMSFQNLVNGHSSVAKMAMKVFVTTSIHLLSASMDTFDDVWKLVLTLPLALQQSIQKKMKIALKYTLTSLCSRMYNNIAELPDRCHQKPVKRLFGLSMVAMTRHQWQAITVASL